MISFPNLDFLFTRLIRRGQKRVDILPVDVFVDNIISSLEIQDVLALRRVSKFFYKLSRTDVIWKRLLTCFEGPLPPLPPTARYSLQGMKGIEAERMLLRALSFDRNWRSNAPDTCRAYSFRAYDTVLSMVLLPGGHYLVASLTDHTHTNYYVAIFVMDYRGVHAYELAKKDTKTKAYDLQAKYLRIKGRDGITISYVRREFKREEPGVNVSDCTDKYELENLGQRFRYACVTYHVSLEHLEKLGDADFWPGSPEYAHYASTLPPPFLPVGRFQSHSKFSSPYLEYLHGVPHLSVIKHPDKIIYKNLETRTTSTLQCLPWDQIENHTNDILAFRNIPFENKVFVIKETESRLTQQTIEFSFEFYKIPASGLDVSQAARECTWWPMVNIRTFQISELVYPSSYDESMQAGSNLKKPLTPPSIHVYCSGHSPERFILFELAPTLGNIPHDSALFYSYPHQQPDSRAALYPSHFYQITDMRKVSWFRFPSDDGTSFILPGTERALVWSITSGDRTDTPPLRNLWSFIKRVHQGSAHGAKPWNWKRKDKKSPRDDTFSTITMEGVLWDHFDRGVQAMAWDETTGRVCIAAAEDSHIYVLDFAHNPREDAKGNRLPLMK